MDTITSRTQNNLLQYHHCDYATVTRIIIHKENDCTDIKSSALIRIRHSKFTVIAFGHKAEPSL